MTGTSSRLSKYRAFASIIAVISIVGGVALIVLASMPGQVENRLGTYTLGAVGILGGLLVIVVSSLLVKIESNTFRLYNQALDMHEQAKQQLELLTRIVENSALSDAAKSLTNRDRECDALRTAIRADVRTEDWEGALNLVDMMETRFGYSEEAAVIRTEINEARLDTMRQKLSAATTVIEKMLDRHEWDKAQHEIERLHKALPDERRVSKLRELLDSRKAGHKAELLAQWHAAVERNDVDAGINILRELDLHLTRDEARALEQSARGVFRAKLLQLGMQFQFAVRDQRWRDAIEVGLQIREEFPNTRMAQEVDEAMEGLRKRAGMQDVEITSG